MRNLKAIYAAALVVLAFPALGQQPAPGKMAPMPGMPMQGMPMTTSDTNVTPSTKAFKAADDKMMMDMNRPMTGNADQDFVAGMLPHHGGAVEMARVEIQYGKDPEMLRLAHGIVAAQEKEIAQMKAWQKKHPKS